MGVNGNLVEATAWRRHTNTVLGTNPKVRGEALGSEDSDHVVENSGESVLPIGEGRGTSYSDSIFHSPRASVERSSSWICNVGLKFNEVFRQNDGPCLEATALKIFETMELNGLEEAPTQSLLNLVNAILGEKENGEVPQRVELLLWKVMQEIEGRVFIQGEHIRKMKLALKEALVREERLISRTGVLETLATGMNEEIKIISYQFQKVKMEKRNMEEKWKLEEQEVLRLRKEKGNAERAISSLNEEFEFMKKSYEQRCLQLETQRKDAIQKMEEKIRRLECCLEDSNRNIEELQALSETRAEDWKLKELGYQNFIDGHLQILGEIRLASQAAKREIVDAQVGWLEQIDNLGVNLKELADAAQNYHIVLDENRRLYNEIQDLKGNIRVYCRVRPFLPGQLAKQTTIQYIGEEGELLVSNPSKPGKDGQRMFRFNKVFGTAATQEEVFMDTQPLIRSVLDGFNVCIFAYGQTGSGKTFTMSGPDPHLVESWGVNYRALNDLFLISQKRKTTYSYEVGVQMVEIYNEQVRDLLISDGSQKRLGIWSSSQPNGLSVPDASMHRVDSTTDVLVLMQIGQMNRAVGATALNERSSRSHSVLTVHVRGTNLETGVALRGSLHLIDLAGSERVERSEATGDRLREAQHINKSLSALGDVIYALAQKSPHVPYRNSKLTQILQGSLGGQAKTLMFVQINPDVESFSETLSTLKFAERVSGVELGAAKTNRESKELRDLMEQVVQLKELVAKKDAEIERLQSHKLHRVPLPGLTKEKHQMNSARHASSSSPNRTHFRGSSGWFRRSSMGNLNRHQSSSSLGDATAGDRKISSDMDNYSECSDRHSETSSPHSFDDFRYQNEYYQSSHHTDIDPTQSNPSVDPELLGLGDGDIEEKISNVSDGCVSMGTETDGSMSSLVELTLFPETSKVSDNVENRTEEIPSAIPHPPSKISKTSFPVRLPSRVKDFSIASTSGLPTRSITVSKSATSTKRSSKRWQ